MLSIREVKGSGSAMPLWHCTATFQNTRATIYLMLFTMLCIALFCYISKNDRCYVCGRSELLISTEIEVISETAMGPEAK